MSLMCYCYKNNRDYRSFDAEWIRRVAARLDTLAAPRIVRGSGLFMEFVCLDNIYTAKADNTIYFSDTDIGCTTDFCLCGMRECGSSGPELLVALG